MIRAGIDAGRLVRVGLVRHHGLSPWGMTQSHQVALETDVSSATWTRRAPP